MSISRNLFIWPVFSSVKLQMYRKCSVFKISDAAVQAYLKNLMLEHDNLNTKAQRTPQESKRLFEIKPIIHVFEQRNNLHDNIEALSRKQIDENDAMEKIKKEGLSYLQRMMDVDRDLQSLLLEPKLTEGRVLLEVTAGAGQEALLFASELFKMYESYATYKDWEICIVSLEKSDIGGIRKASMFIDGVGVPELMKIETGVHRVQRIPATEKGGRIQTSTVSVVVLPKPTDIDGKNSDRDLVIKTEQECGAGGQHVDATGSEDCVSNTLTGTETECQESISEENNEGIVIQKLRTVLWRNENEEQTSKSEREPKAVSEWGDANLVKFNAKTRLGCLFSAKRSQIYPAPYFRGVTVPITEELELLGIGLSCLKDLVRTYDHCEDIVMEHRQGGGIAHNLQEFMEGDYLLEQVQNNLLRINWRQDFLEEINQFAAKINSKTADTN